MIWLNESESGKYDFTYLLKKFGFPDYAKYANDDTIMYHNTPYRNVDSIVKNGLRCDLAKADISSTGVIKHTWATNVPYDQNKYGGCTIAFRLDTDSVRAFQQNTDQYTIIDDVTPNDIVFVDTFVSDREGLLRVSDIPRLIKRGGEQHYRDVLEQWANRGVELFYDIDTLIEYAKRN